MTASFKEILKSRLFKFVVGEKVDGHPTTFLVHEDAISHLSKPLYSLLKSGLSESQAGCTIWDDVSEDTFVRFAQFAYTGDYSIPSPQKRSRAAEKRSTNEYSSSTANCMDGRVNAGSQYEAEVDDAPVTERTPEIVEDPEPETEESWGRSFGKGKKDKKKKNKPERFGFGFGWEDSPAALEPEPEPVPESEFASIPKRDKYPDASPPPHSADFESLSFPLLAPLNNYNSTCEPPNTYDSTQSYSEQFLSHATLYILGDCQLIDSLKALALYKLHKTLCVFQLSDENIQDVVDLARLAYTEEGGGGKGDAGDDIGALRRLVCRYMATNAMVLCFDEGFMDLLEEGGQFVRDFFRFEVQRTT